MDDASALIEAADLNGLLRLVDSMCDARRWDDLLELADRCHDALERGKQLWPIEAHIEYRVALEGPGPYAAEMLGSDLNRFMLGPLTEVVGSSHPWGDVVDHIAHANDAAYVAQERVLRGEVLSGDARAAADLLHLPLTLQPWEPAYALATYRSDHVEVMEPFDATLRLEPLTPQQGEPLEDPELEDVLLEIVHAWTAQSNGAATTAIVDGPVEAAIGAIAPQDAALAPVPATQALRELAWAAASGGAHGSRRGSAFGRFMTYYLCAQLGDLSWPADPDEVGRAVGGLRWYRWDEGEPERGWVLRIGVASPEGWSVAIGATDILEEGVEPRWLS